MSRTLDVANVRRRFLLLRGLRWLPTGLIVPVLVLLLSSRGLSLTQIGLVAAMQGVLILLLELPTGGLADTVGRRPVLLVATMFEVATLVLIAATSDVRLLLLAFALQGVYRALESGPLDAWFVDAALAADPDADVEGGLGAGGVVLGVAMAVGSLAAAALVALEPLGPDASLVAPVVLAIALRMAEFVAILVLVVEPRPVRSGAGFRAATSGIVRTVGSVVRLARGSVALVALLAAELVWGFSSAAFELLPPVRLGELTGSADQAAMLMGPASAAAWFAVALGSGLVPRLSRRVGSALAAGLCRALHGVAVIVMGAATGPVGVLVAYVVTFGAHGAFNVPFAALLHREADAGNRTTVLSASSMLGMGAGALGGIAIGALADATSIVAAMLVGGGVLLASAPLFLLARRDGEQGGCSAGEPDDLVEVAVGSVAVPSRPVSAGSAHHDGSGALSARPETRPSRGG